MSAAKRRPLAIRITATERRKLDEEAAREGEPDYETFARRVLLDYLARAAFNRNRRDR